MAVQAHSQQWEAGAQDVASPGSQPNGLPTGGRLGLILIVAILGERFTHRERSGMDPTELSQASRACAEPRVACGAGPLWGEVLT